MKIIKYLAWAWIIIIGGLMITPKWIFCIKCGVPIDAPGYIGDPAVTFLGIGSITLGVVGLITSVLEVTQGKSLDKAAKTTQGSTWPTRASDRYSPQISKTNLSDSGVRPGKQCLWRSL